MPVTSRRPTRARRARRAAPRGAGLAGEFMRALREDHAGLSRVLREIEVQAAALGHAPEAARAVLGEAMRYLLVYQHSVHHPREDMLFDRIRRREPALFDNMKRLVFEHRIGQERAGAIDRELRRASAAALRGRPGARVARMLTDYVKHTRAHMRREEAVFYSGAERVLTPADWAALADGAPSRDPAGDLHRLAARHPRLAARLAAPERQVSGPSGAGAATHDRVRLAVEQLAEACGTALRESADLARDGVADLAGVRSPVALAKVSVSIAARSVRHAARVAVLPFRR